MSTLLASIAAELANQLATLVSAYTYLGRQRFLSEFRQALTDYHGAAYMAGQRNRTLTAGGVRTVQATVNEQMRFAEGFAEALDGGLTDAQATARATLYAGALKATFSRGANYLWPLPFHPADGATECKMHCKCRWVLNIYNLEELDADAYWTLGGGEHCPGCIRRSGTTYRIRGGRLQ